MPRKWLPALLLTQAFTAAAEGNQAGDYLDYHDQGDDYYAAKVARRHRGNGDIVDNVGYGAKEEYGSYGDNGGKGNHGQHHGGYSAASSTKPSQTYDIWDPYPAYEENVTVLSPENQQMFINVLPIPAVRDLTGKKAKKGKKEVLVVSMEESTHDFGLQALCGATDGYGGNYSRYCRVRTDVYGYDGLYPGPTIAVESNHEVHIKWENNIPGFSHLLSESLDPDIHCGLDKDVTDCASNDGNQVRTVVHLHGGHTPWKSDGYPEAWYTYKYTETGSFFWNKVSTYPNSQEAATLWYHDHAMGITRLNVYAGLVGYYVVTDDFERSLIKRQRIPDAHHTLPLLIQDKGFNADGSLFYSSTNVIQPENFQPYIMVNGAVWPYVDVEPVQYRFRIICGSDSRFFNLRIMTSMNETVPMTIIARGQGFADETMTVNHLLIAPGQRYGIVVDFQDYAGSTLIMTNDALTPFPNGGFGPDTEAEVLASPAGKVMQFRVGTMAKVDHVRVPQWLKRPGYMPDPDTLEPFRRVGLWEIDESLTDNGNPLPLLGNASDSFLWTDPTTETPTAGTWEVWEIENNTPDAHPIHLHLVQFAVISRFEYTPNSSLDIPTNPIRDSEGTQGPDIDLQDGDFAPMDTVVVPPLQGVRIMMFFPLSGLYVWHCHILSHEDNEMMRNMEVLPAVDSKQAYHIAQYSDAKPDQV